MHATGKRIAMVAVMAVALAGLAGPVQADQLDVVIDGETAWHGITASYWHGQTFTPTQPFLTAVELWGLGEDHPWSGGLTDGTTITATIYEANGFSGINLNLGAQLGSATRAIPMAAGGAQQWNGRFELGVIDVSARVGAATNSALVALFTAGPGFTGEESVNIHQGNIYSQGTAVQSNNGGATWTWDLLGPTVDLRFRTYGDPIPEPATFGLVAGAMLLGLARRRRR